MLTSVLSERIISAACLTAIIEQAEKKTRLLNYLVQSYVAMIFSI